MLLFLFYGERQRHKIMPKIISCEGMDVSGDDTDLALTVLTCEGDLRDPAFPNRLRQIICKLKRLVSDDNKKPFQVTKVEPWNSVRVTFNIPRNAAQRLRQLAERGDNTLRELGILSVQIEGDQVITLTLANNFNESHELLLGKGNDSVVNNSANVVTSSSVNSSAININNNEITLTYNRNHVNNNSLISTSSSVVSSVSSTLDFIGSPSSGPSVEITRKNIAQYLSQQHGDVVTTNSNSVLTTCESSSDRLPAFRSPNVVAPANNEPIPYLNSSASSTLTSQSSTSVTSNAITCNVSSSTGTRVSNQSIGSSIGNPSLREVQSSYGLFPFASMQHAMHTKQGLNSASHYTSVQRPNQVITTPSIRLPLTFGQTQASQSLPNNPSLTHAVSTIASITSSNSNIPSISKPQSTYIRDAKNAKVCQQSQTSQSPQTQPQPQPIAVATALNQSCANANGASANVALTSPLLVNLLQSDGTSGHHKVMAPPPPSSLNQINALSDSGQKRKPRKSRKSKDKIDSENSESTHFTNSNPVTTQTSVSITPTTTPILKHLPSNPFPQQSGMDSTSSMPTPSSFQHLISIPIGSMSRFPTIHPEAQGQPQVVRAGHLSLRPQLNRPQVSAAIVGSPPIAATHLRKPLYVTTAPSCSKSFPAANTQIKPHEEKSSLILSTNALNAKVCNTGNEKESDTNPVFPSPPTSRISSKTKHLINPFTGLLEPMLSDEEEEDRPSPATIFPELDAGSDVGGLSERSLSDTGSNGKDNNHSSDTDSGLGKSGTDVSSQSSIDVVNGDTPTHTNEISSNTTVPANDGSSADKPKLRVKMESQKECSTPENFPTTSSSNSLFHSRSHFTNQKSIEPSNTSFISTQCIENQVLIAEPRVPPLHISIRGPNSAVVVSNRRDSTSELEMKASVSKKVRAVRTTRAMSAESTLGNECTNNLNKNQRKKLQREQRFLSGGGIVTSNLSLCASPSVESLVDINRTINDSSFASNLSETVETVFLQSSKISSKCAQNKLNDNNNDNISTNKSVPLIHNEDINTTQECAIHITSDSDDVCKTTVSLIDDNIANQQNKDLDSVQVSIPTPDSASVSLASIISDDSDSNIDKSDIKCEAKPSSPVNMKSQTCHTNNELTNSDQISSETDASISQTDNILLKDREKSNENFKRKMPVAAVVTVEPLIDANTDIVSKISRIGRINCIPSAIPALVTTRELSSARTTNLFHSTNSMSPNSPLDQNAIEDESNHIITMTETTSTLTKLNFDIPESLNRVSETFTPESNTTTSITVNSHSQQTSSIVLNGDVKCENSNSLPNSVESNNLETVSNTNEHELNDLCESPISVLVKNDDQNKELNNLNHDSHEDESPKFEIPSEAQQKEEPNDLNANETVSKLNELPINTNNLSVSESTATSNSFNKSVSETSKVEKTKPDYIASNNDLRTIERSVCSEDKAANNDNKSDKAVTQTSSQPQSQPTIISNSLRSEELAKQLQIVITTTVPSFTTNTSTSMFPQLKPSTLESGSRVTLITFKPNLNSPNTSTSKSSDFTNTSLTNAMPQKAVPFKLLTIPSGSGGITVRSAANKLVELINSTTSSPVSPLSPNTSGGSPLPINTTSPPVRLLVSKMATAGSVTQTGVPVSVAGNSIGQLVVVKSVVVTNPSPSIKLVPAKSPSINSSSLLIPVNRTNSPIESVNAININNEQKPIETSHLLIPNQINNNPTIDESSNSESDVQNQDSNSTDVDLPQLEPVDLTVQCQDSQSLTCSEDTKLEDIDCEGIPRLIRSSIVSENETQSDEEMIDDKMHSVATDHNYIMKKSSDDEDIDETLLDLSSSCENLDSSKDNELMKLDDDEYNTLKMPEFQSENSLQPQLKQSQDLQSRPNKRKSSENAAELIKACMGVEDSPKRNSSFSYSPSFSITTSVTPLVQNISSRTRASSLDNDCVTTNESSETNFLNKTKNLRLRKGKVSSEPPYLTETLCSSDEEIEIKDTSGISWGNKPRLRTTGVQKNQKINKQRNANCKDSNKDKTANRSNEKGKKGRDRDQISRASSTQRSTRRTRDQNIIMSSTDISLHTNESVSEPLHMEIVGLELSNDSSANNYNCDTTTTASTTSPIITSSLLVKRKTRVGLNNTEQSEGVVTKRRRIVKETHR